MYKHLAASIIIKAIEDYRELKKYGIKKLITIDEGVISIKELEQFFNSDYCDILLSYLLDMTGKELWNILQDN